MRYARDDLGTAKVLRAEVFGEPGERTFRVLAEAEKGTASVWMEKEQLSALALSIKGYLDEMSEAAKRVASAPASASASRPSFDFKLTSIGLTYDESEGKFGILAYDEKDHGSQMATIAWWTPQSQAEAMAEEALAAVAAGRPVCPLCHRAMDKEGHACPHYNGHGSVQDHL